MTRELRDYVDDILNAMTEVREFTVRMDFGSFSTDRKTINAVVRSLEVIGEASKQIPDEIREQHPLVPWKYMAGMRDKLSHEYWGVDLEIVWRVVQEELPLLEPHLRKVRGQLESGSECQTD